MSEVTIARRSAARSTAVSRRLRFFVLGLLGACATTHRASDSSSSPEATVRESDAVVMERGREFTRQFYDRQLDSLWSQMNEQMIQALRTVDDFARFRQVVDEQLGSEIGVLEEVTTETSGIKVYLRKASFSKVGKPVRIQWAIDSEGKITGFFVQPAR